MYPTFTKQPVRDYSITQLTLCHVGQRGIYRSADEKKPKKHFYEQNRIYLCCLSKLSLGHSFFSPTHSSILVRNFIPLCVKTFQSCFYNRGPDIIPQFSRQTKNKQQRQQKMTRHRMTHFYLACITTRLFKYQLHQTVK